MGGMEAKHPAEIGFGLPVALQPAENGAAKHQKLGLIRRAAEPLGQDVYRFGGLLQAVEQPGEMQASLDVARLELQQLAIGADGVTGKGSRGQLVCPLQPLLGQTTVPGRRRPRLDRWGQSCALWVMGTQS
jgi:hypothetical protein